MKKFAILSYLSLFSSFALNAGVDAPQVVNFSLTVSAVNSLTVSTNTIGFQAVSPNGSTTVVNANSPCTVTGYSNSGNGHSVTLSIDNALVNNKYVLKGQTYGDTIPFVLSLANDRTGVALASPKAITPSSSAVTILDSGQGGPKTGAALENSYYSLSNTITAYADFTGINSTTVADTYVANVTLTHIEY